MLDHFVPTLLLACKHHAAQSADILISSFLCLLRPQQLDLRFILSAADPSSAGFLATLLRVAVDKLKEAGGADGVLRRRGGGGAMI